jgi:hypothetical protein
MCLILGLLVRLFLRRIPLHINTALATAYILESGFQLDRLSQRWLLTLAKLFGHVSFRLFLQMRPLSNKSWYLPLENPLCLISPLPSLI